SVWPKSKPLQQTRTRFKEESLNKPGSTTAVQGGSSASVWTLSAFYGLYVVKTGDEMGNLLFSVLREYLNYRGLPVVNSSELPKDGSSPVPGLTVIYPDDITFIYNFKTRHLDNNLNIANPNQKLLIFDLTRLEGMLGSLKIGNSGRIHFEGRNIYFGVPPSTGSKPPKL
ncbi:MAG: hypothetical protein HQK55_12950, partial [Deltaproteobacteria bacterium]|nr:hypothetical protein [Deltaproteobacteria bacterium]